MPNETQSVDKIAMGKTSIQLLTRIAAGGLVAASAASGWPVIVVAAGLTTMALYGYQQYRNKVVDETSLLDLYRRDIASIQHKAPENVTLADLKELAKPVEKGGKGIRTFQQTLQYDNHQQLLHMAAEAISTVLISGALIALISFPSIGITGHFSLMHVSFGILTGGAYALGHRLVDAALDKVWGKENRDKGINTDIQQLADQMTHTPVKSHQVFELIVKTNPALQKEIKASYGDTYEKLSLDQREEIVKSTEPEMAIEALTKAINKGEIKPSFIGFLAYGQADVSSDDNTKYEMLRIQTPTMEMQAGAALEKQLGTFVERFLSEAEQLSPFHTIN